jgi:hypothetical protein
MEGRRLSRRQLRSLPDAASFSPEVAASPGLVGSGQLGLGLSAAFETLPPVPSLLFPDHKGGAGCCRRGLAGARAGICRGLAGSRAAATPIFSFLLLSL